MRVKAVLIYWLNFARIVLDVKFISSTFYLIFSAFILTLELKYFFRLPWKQQLFSIAQFDVL